MKKRFFGLYALYLLLFTLMANSFPLIPKEPRSLFFIIPALLLILLFAGSFLLKKVKRHLKVCCHGLLLLCIFAGSLIPSILFHIVLAVHTIPDQYQTFLWSALYCIGVEALLFWVGIICVYLTSLQLGIKQRVIGILCGMIPIANLIALSGIIRTVFREIHTEYEKFQLNAARQGQQICKTRYPILMVHGVFFRDSRYFNYWGRVPGELERNGATVHYGNHPSAASVAESARELSQRIKEIVAETHCEKVNIIAHSKGGLDCRYALSQLDAAPYVASLTTINTPHRGCLFADYLLDKIPESLKEKVASAYNTALKKFGEPNADFMAAVNDLTASACEKRNEELTMPKGIFSQSVGSIMPKAGDGKFPLNFSYHLVKYFDGPNDGLVSESSFQWGEDYTLLKPHGNRGISHGDMIDLNRENIEDFDVREFYVQLVHRLKEKGL